MEGLPVIHVVSVMHLCFVAGFVALYICEVVVEAANQQDELHPIGIRMHYLLDIFVEIPFVSGILITGIVLSLLVQEVTTPHVWLIAFGTTVVLACYYSFFKYVRSRKRLIGKETFDHEKIDKIRTQFGIFSFVVINPALLMALGVGFWLAHQRALEAFLK